MIGKLFSSMKVKIGRGANGNVILQGNDIQNLVVVDSSTDLIKTYSELERFDLVSNHVLKTLESASRLHPLYPDFGVKVDNDMSRLISSPKNIDAIRKNPKIIKGTFHFDYSKYPHMNKNENPWEYSYRTQTPVEFETTSYKEYLGDIVDPYPIVEFEDGMKTRIFPPHFPPAVEGVIKAGEISIPVLIQRKPCVEYGKIVIGTVSEGCGFEINITRYNNLNKTDITISRVTGCDLYVQLQREKLIRSLFETRHLIITVGSSQLLNTIFDEDVLNHDLFQNENIIQFIESLIDIEEKIECKFDRNIEDFTVEDFKTARILASSLNDKWHSFKSDFDDEIRVEYDSFFVDIEEVERANSEIRAELDVFEINLLGLKFTADKYLVLFRDAKINNKKSVVKNIKRKRRDILVTFRPIDDMDYFIKYCKFVGIEYSND